MWKCRTLVLVIFRDAVIYRTNIGVSWSLPCWLLSACQQIRWHLPTAASDAYLLCHINFSQALSWASGPQHPHHQFARLMYVKDLIINDIPTTKITSAYLPFLLPNVSSLEFCRKDLTHGSPAEIVEACHEGLNHVFIVNSSLTPEQSLSK